jgi:carboxyl-terminal processing protease
VRSRLEGDDVGLIRVTQFNEQAADGLKQAIIDLTTQSGDNLKGFVIDLRNNPGGLLDQAISVSNAFLEKGEIVSIRGRSILRASMHTRAISPRESRLLF